MSDTPPLTDDGGVGSRDARRVCACVSVRARSSASVSSARDSHLCVCAVGSDGVSRLTTAKSELSGRARVPRQSGVLIICRANCAPAANKPHIIT